MSEWLLLAILVVETWRGVANTLDARWVRRLNADARRQQEEWAVYQKRREAEFDAIRLKELDDLREMARGAGQMEAIIAQLRRQPVQEKQ